MMDIVKMTLSASLLILAIVVIRALSLHRLPKKMFLVLWGIVLCRLLVPVSIPSPFSVYTVVDLLKASLTDSAVAPVSSGGTAASSIPALSDVVNPALTEGVNLPVPPVLVIWLIGMSACTLFFLVTHLRCRRRYKTALPVDNELISQWLHEHPLRRTIQIRQSDQILAPLTYGIWRPVILLPKTTDWADETRLCYILTHEYVHIRRFDTLYKLLLAAALCLYWMNSFVWLMYILANRDLELACDETVVRTLGETQKSAYALALIGLEEKRSKLAPLCSNFSKNAIEERIWSIMKMKRPSLAGIILASVLVVGTAAVFATNATVKTVGGPDLPEGGPVFIGLTADFEINTDGQAAYVSGGGSGTGYEITRVEMKYTFADFKKWVETGRQKAAALVRSGVWTQLKADIAFASYEDYIAKIEKDGGLLLRSGTFVPTGQLVFGLPDAYHPGRYSPYDNNVGFLSSAPTGQVLAVY